MNLLRFLHRSIFPTALVSRRNKRVRRKTGTRSQQRFRPVLEVFEERTVFATHFNVSVLPASPTAGVLATMSVTAENADNSIDTAYLGTVQFASSDGRAILPGPSALSHGVGNFNVTLLTSGTQSISATDDVNSAITGQANFVVVAAATSQFLVTGLASSITAGVTGNITVTAADLYGNQTSGYTGTVHFASSDVQAILPADHTLTNGSGIFSVTLKTAGTQTLSATDTVNANIMGSLGAIPQTAVIYSQPPNPAGGGVKSAWYAPGGQGMDGDQYVWDSFVLGSSQTINEIHWRGFYAYSSYHSSNIPSCPVSDFTVSIYSTSPYPGVNEPNIFAKPILQYSVGGNANETAAGTFGNVPMYDYSFTLPTAFQAVASTKYWVQIEASQSVAPQTSWPPDWSLAYATGGDNSYFTEIIGGTLAGGNLFRTVSGNDTAFSLVTYTNATGVIVNPAAMSRLNVSGFTSPTTAGMSGNVTVTASDPYGNVTPGYSGTVHFTSSDAQAVLPGDTTLNNGVGTFGATLKTAGTQSLTATDTVNSALHGSQSDIAVSPASAHSMTMVGFPSAVTVGVTNSLSISLWDTYGNVATGYTGTVTFSSTDPQAALPADYTFQAADQGTHIFAAGLNTVGAWSLSAHDTLTSGLAANQSNIRVYPPISLDALSFAEWTVSRGGYNGAIAVSGGAGGYTGLNVTGLPAGLRAGLSANVVTLGGTPTTAGTFTFTVSLLDSVGISASRSYTITIEPSTTLAWTGLGGDNRWSNAANWTGAVPIAGNTLDFGPGALQKTTVNDLAPGTGFKAILFEDSGYALSGNAIRLSGGIQTTNAVAGTDAIALNIALTANQTFTVTANSILQLRGVISGGSGITKAGAGTMVYAGSAANTYSGSTTVTGGILQLDNAVGNAIVGPVTVGAGANVWYGAHDNQVSDTATVTVAAGGTFDLSGRTDKIGALAISGGTVATGAGTLTLGGNINSTTANTAGTISGGLDLGGLVRTLTVAHGTAAEDLVITANVGNGGLIKAGTGALVLSGNNSYAGSTTVKAGVLDVQNSSALGTSAGATSVAAGATLEIEAGNGLSFADTLTLGGGTLMVLGGANTWTGNIALTSNSNISVAASQLTLSGMLSGAGGVTKTGAGTLAYSGSTANTYTGATTVSGGILQLDNGVGNAIAGPLTVGAGTSVRYFGHVNQISDTAKVTVGAGGTLDLNGQSDKVGSLVMNGGTVNTGAGTLILGGNVMSNATAVTAFITGNLDLGGVTRTITVAPGTALESLIIEANVSNGGLIKAGTGALVLSGNNTYSGLTSDNAGVLDVQSSSALGSTANGTTVAGGATLEIEGTGWTFSDALTLAGGKTPSVVMVGGTNTWAGNIVLSGTATFNVNGGQLTLGGAISGAGGLTKTGAGKLLVNGANNTFAGITTVGAGTLGGIGKLGRVTMSAGAHLAPGTGGPGVLTTGNLNFALGSFFEVEVNGASAGSGYDQLASSGTVALNRATLDVSLGNFTPLSGSSFTIIARTNADASNSTFVGLPENSTFIVGGTTFKITYVGGVGHHDVVLTVL